MKEILPSGQTRVMEQARLTYTPLEELQKSKQKQLGIKEQTNKNN